MSYANVSRHKLVTRGSVRTGRHGNWRQTFVDCAGMCIAKVNGSELPCGDVDFLELHEQFGEGDGRLQQRILLCNMHHAVIEDRGHQAALIMDQYKPSRLSEDVSLEIILAGGVDAWMEKHNLDGSRFGCMLFSGPHVEDYGDG